MSEETFVFPVGVRWKCVGVGSQLPEGSVTIYFEWEDGSEASFTTWMKAAREFHDAWMEDEDQDPEWSDDPLPEWLSSSDWSSGDWSDS